MLMPRPPLYNKTASLGLIPDISDPGLIIQHVLNYVFNGTSACGLLTNTFVLIQMIRIIKQKRNETANWVLVCVSCSDLLCLLSLWLFQNLADVIFLHSDYSEALKSAFCSFFIYIRHTTSACTIWCWATFSFLWYYSITHPISYFKNKSRLQNTPAIILTTFSVCATLEIWIFLFIQYAPEPKACQMILQISTSLPLATGILLIESIWSDFLPGIVLVVLNLIAFSKYHNGRNQKTSSYQKKASLVSSLVDTDNQRSTLQVRCDLKKSTDNQRPQQHQMNQLKRYLMFSSLNLALNIPLASMNIAGMVLGPGTKLFQNPLVNYLFEWVSYILYCLQFSVNILYLRFLVMKQKNHASKKVQINQL